ncbi:hypothetical protein GCM10023148_56340 [Actinokineospora soli]
MASAERGRDRLAERVSAAGLPNAVTVTGTPWPLNPGADLSVFRVVQESLTNALKHAGPATAEVALAYETDRLVVRISDNGRGEAGESGGEHGLIGMRERAALYGGTLSAGTAENGGFAVVLTLPRSAAASLDHTERDRGG